MEVMDHISLHTIRRFANRSKRWLWSYIDGPNEEERKHAEKVYKSHRQAINKDFFFLDRYFTSYPISLRFLFLDT
jgi:hypothetical protein